MNTTEIKSRIINKINSISNQEVLEEIYKIVDIETEIDSVYKLSVDERKADDEGMKDIENGNVYTSEEANILLIKILNN